MTTDLLLTLKVDTKIKETAPLPFLPLFGTGINRPRPTISRHDFGPGIISQLNIKRITVSLADELKWSSCLTSALRP